MKFICTLSFTLIVFLMQSQTPCNNGMAGSFPCDGYDLLSQIPLSTMGSNRANDSWGWTDPQDGKEYVIICLNEATAFIDVSDPLNPVYLGKLPTVNSSSTWRDAKTYNNYAFIVSEDNGHGIQIFDLTRLRNVSNPPEIFTEDAHYSGFGGAHNIAINEETGYAYGVGGTTHGGGPHFVNIQDPLNPVGEGGFSGQGYTHDAQVVIYDGPDADHTGKEILFGSNEDVVVIVDVTNKNNPQLLSTIGYSNINYTHQGWLTEDQRYFLLGDEQDEINTGIDTRTVVFDLSDLDNPQFHFSYTGPTPATDHNGYVKGNKFYLSNNTAGLRVVDISGIASGTMTEEGFFDSFPSTNNSGYDGAWNVYPYFGSGNIVISDRSAGMLLVRSQTLGTDSAEFASGISVTPNPAYDSFRITSEGELINSVVITNMLGQKVYSEENLGTTNHYVVISSLTHGMYFVTINNSATKKLIKE
jgi:choice-of-anchor B domain-containing protein